jgi:aminopeptidase N
MATRFLFVIKIVSFFLLIAACHPHKKTIGTQTTPVSEPAILLDTISVIANEPPQKIIYQASNTVRHDIIHTQLEVNFDWKLCQLIGKASMQLKPHFYATDKLYLNARGMDIVSVKVFDVDKVIEKKTVGNRTIEENANVWNNIVTSSFKYENDSIKINLGRSFTNKEIFLVEIDYVAKPNELKSGGSAAITEDTGIYFINPTGENKRKMPQIWTQGETQSSSAWFPTIDSPNSKTTQEIFMTVENKYTTLSNGILVESKKNEDDTRTDHWKLDLPHSPYLAMMVVGEFKKVMDAPWNGKEISYYVEKEYEPYAKAIFGDTKEMIEFYSSKLGVPYAWPKYAQIVVRDYVSGAMENTSATLHGDFMVYQTPREMVDGKKGNPVIAHELFHQWFGDLVTSESWSNLPLNESFATYGEYLWEEYKNGRDAADYHHYQSKQGYLASKKEVNLIRFDYEDREDMFDGFSYNKGGQVLHMLRKAVGDEAFFTSLKKYLENNKFKSAEIHNLRLAFEDVTGTDMNWFFNQWFLNKGRPKLKVTQNFNATTSCLELTIEQNQDLKNAPLYTLPVEVDIYADGSFNRGRLLITEQKQTFTLVVNSKPQLVNFDAERQLLCDLDYIKTQEEYVFQYKNAPLFEDRLEALKHLESTLSNAVVLAVFKDAAKNDKFFAVQNFAIGELENVENDSLSLKTLFADIYLTTKNTRTRAKALRALNTLSTSADVMTLNEKALSEQSYAICGEALNALAKNNPTLALEKAKALEKESGKDILYPIAELYSKHGTDEQLPFFKNALNYFNGFETISFSSYYAKLVKKSSNATNVVSAAKDLETINMEDNRYTKYAAKKAIKDILDVWESKEKTLMETINVLKKENKETVTLNKELQVVTAAKNELNRIYGSLK